jgi:outer membrane receptor for ferrienterochelin and colicins
MYLKINFLTIGLVLLACLSALGQHGVNLSGRIFSEDGEPLAFCSVLLRETNQGTASGGDGQFTIANVTPGSYTLVLSSVGMRRVENAITVGEGGLQIGEIRMQDDLLDLHQVVVTATRIEMDRSEAPVACNIVDDKILKATQSITLSEGLRFQPALRIENNCQNCGFNGLRMNGLEGAYSQVLIDGRPIYSSLQGVYGLEQIPSNMIERVEIVRSGGSALYGSSAVAGTVNVITREPRENQFYLSTNQGFSEGGAADQAYMLGADVVGKDLNAGASVYAFQRNRDWWDANGDGYSDIGELDAQAVGFKSFYKPSRYNKLVLQGYAMNEYRRGGNAFDLPPHEADIAEYTDHDILNGGVTFEQYTRDHRHKFSLYSTLQGIRRKSYYGAEQDPNAYGNTSDFGAVAGVQHSTTLPAAGHTLVSGVEFNHNRLIDSAPAYNRSIDQRADQLGIFAQDTWTVHPKLTLLFGGRLDLHNLLENPVGSPRINLLYRLNPDWQVRAGYARGFRAPQVFDEDLHITQVGGGGTVISNAPGLGPEYSNAWSASAEYNKYIGDRWALGLTIDAFYTRLANVFILEEQGIDGDDNLLLERRNGPGARVQGLSVNPKLLYGKTLELQLSLTAQRSNYDEPVQWSENVDNTQTRFFRTPDLYGFYVLTWNALPGFSLNMSGVYTGSMIVPHYSGYIDRDHLETTRGFFEHNFKADYAFDVAGNLQLTFSGGVQNIGNSFQRDLDQGMLRDSAYIYGPMRPRTVFLGMSLNL